MTFMTTLPCNLTLTLLGCSLENKYGISTHDCMGPMDSHSSWRLLWPHPQLVKQKERWQRLKACNENVAKKAFEIIYIFSTFQLSFQAICNQQTFHKEMDSQVQPNFSPSLTSEPKTPSTFCGVVFSSLASPRY